MRAARRPLGLLVLLAALGAGCGTTKIVTDDPRARIYADGRMVGQGQGEITRRGLPGGTTVVVATEDGRRETSQVRREFTLSTFVFGLFTYGVCLIACWEYPSTVFLPTARPAHPGFAPPGGGPPAAAVDPWLQPPTGYPAAAPAP